jgi:hypothetical protein
MRPRLRVRSDSPGRVERPVQFMFAIAQVVPALPEFTIVDVGPSHPANPQRWQGLLDAGAARVVGFEALPDVCSDLRAAATPGHAFLPLAIADGTQRTLYRTAFPGGSSLYEPNQPFLRLFRNMSAPFEVIATERVATHRLDDVEALRDSGCDLMNFDIFGAAFDALANATRLLERVVVVDVKVPLAPMHRNQPMLGEVDGVLRRSGFIVHRYLQSSRGTIEHPSLDGGPGDYLNQELWAEIVYVKDFTHAASLPAELWIKLGVLVHELYEAHDLAHRAFAHADARSGDDLARRYLVAFEAATPEREDT